MAHNRNLIVLVGPTAVGKTAMAIKIAKALATEIISADSRQIYKEMQIGTAVPTAEELAEVKHHFVQTKSVFDYYNASMFEVDVLHLLDQLFEKYTSVVMVGGSTLYVDSVCYGIDDLPAVDMVLRKELMEKYQQEGIEYLRQQLKQLDPEHYSKVDLRNPNRMLKAIEITLMSGKPYSAHLTATRKERPFNLIKLGLDLPRPQLFERINRRVDKMLESGLVSEVQSLVYAKNENALRTVGYREIFSFIEGEHTLDEAVEQIKTNTRRYAKRQLTWFSRTKEMPWFSPSDFEMIVDYVAKHQQ